MRIDRFQSEVDLRKYLLAIESMAEGVLLVDERGKTRYASPPLLRSLKYEFEADIAFPSLFDFDQQLNESVWQQRWQSLSNTEWVFWSVNFRQSGGKLLDYYLQAKWVYVADKSTPYACLVLNRVDRRQDTLFQLYVFCARYLRTVAWEWDLQTGYFQTTREFSDLFRLPATAATDHQTNIVILLKDHLPTEQIRRITKAIKDVQQHGKAVDQQYEVMIDDKRQTLRFHYLPVLANGKVSKVRGLIQPEFSSTDHRGDSLFFLTPVMERLNLIIFCLYRDGDFYHVNQYCCKTLGYTAKDLKEQYTIAKVDVDNPPGFWPSTFDELRQRPGDPLVIESTFQRVDGTVFPVELSVSSVNDGSQDLLCVIGQDITRRRREEAQLRSALLELNSMSRQLETENLYLREELNENVYMDFIVSKSAKYKQILHQVEMVAPTDSTVLIEGETGTGKELLARAIHRLSRRADQRMVKVNCAALPKTLIESELFGHEKGAFTGADRRKPGRFEMADGGTLFLDEIGELPEDTQVKLLRVLQEGEFERVGGTKSIIVDVRLITATNRNLKQMVEEGRFRSDLYYRLHVFPITNLPLRERREDIPLLVQHFIKIYAGKMGKDIRAVKPADLERLQQYEFPGNIRELENIVARSVILTKGKTLNLADWSPLSGNAATDHHFPSLDDMQRRHIVKALEQTGWRVSGPQGAARLLGLKDQTLFSKMRKFGIERSEE